MSNLYEDTKTINLDEYTIIDNLKDRYIQTDFKDSSDFKTLVNSIKKNGVITPLIFARIDDKKLELISGRRRLSAIDVINKTPKEYEKIKRIPVSILKKDTPLSDKYVVAYIENNQRQDLPVWAKVESICYAIYTKYKNISNDVFYFDEGFKGDFIDTNGLDDVFFAISNIYNNQDNSYNEKEKQVMNAIKEISKAIQSTPEKIIKEILDYKISFRERILLLNMGLSLKDLIFARKHTELYSELKNIMKAYIDTDITDTNTYNTLKEFFEMYGLNISSYINIDEINSLEYADKKKKLIPAFTEIINQFSERVKKVELEIKETEKTKIKTKVNTAIKKLSDEKLELLLAYIEKITADENQAKEVKNG